MIHPVDISLFVRPPQHLLSGHKIVTLVSGIGLIHWPDKMSFSSLGLISYYSRPIAKLFAVAISLEPLNTIYLETNRTSL